MTDYLHSMADVEGWNLAELLAAREAGCASYYCCDRDDIGAGTLDALMARAADEGYEVYLDGEAVMLRDAG